MRPEAPLLHDKGITANGNVYVDIHGEVGNTAEGFAAADVVHEGVYSTSRVQHVHLETHGSIAWTAPDGRVHVRTSSQAPFIAQQKLCHIFGLRPRDVHVFTERVGGGFGGKQEMLTEDLCVLAALKTGRPVKWEFTREEQFIGATTRHPMTAKVRLGARRDGTLTAIEVRVVSNTGAYGGHGGETLAAALAGPLAAYRCPNKKADGYAVYTNMVPAGGFRGYGSSQTTFAIECAIDDLAQKLGLDPFEIRRRNMIRPDDWIGSIWGDPSDVDFGSYGLDQCMDLVEARAQERARHAQAGRRGMGGGNGFCARHAGMRAADRASLRRRDAPAGGWPLSPGGRIDGNGQRLCHLASADRRRGAGDAGRSDRHHQCRY